jgi:hypothetical protein
MRPWTSPRRLPLVAAALAALIAAVALNPSGAQVPPATPAAQRAVGPRAAAELARRAIAAKEVPDATVHLLGVVNGADGTRYVLARTLADRTGDYAVVALAGSHAEVLYLDQAPFLPRVSPRLESRIPQDELAALIGLYFDQEETRYGSAERFAVAVRQGRPLQGLVKTLFETRYRAARRENAP